MKLFCSFPQPSWANSAIYRGDLTSRTKTTAFLLAEGSKQKEFLLTCDSTLSFFCAEWEVCNTKYTAWNWCIRQMRRILFAQDSPLWTGDFAEGCPSYLARTDITIFAVQLLRNTSFTRAERGRNRGEKFPAFWLASARTSRTTFFQGSFILLGKKTNI